MSQPTLRKMLSKAVKFRIESISLDGPHACVSAAHIEGEFVKVSPGTLLGGVRLATTLHEPRPGMFLFRLENSSDAPKLSVGSIVEFEW